jgi:predicted GNAT family acetyltransferase
VTGTTKAADFTTRLLTEETWPDFAALVEANNGVWGGCWCMGFHPEGFGDGTSVERNREVKHGLVGSGAVHQVLVYRGDEAVGWCQFGSPGELPNIKNRTAYEAGVESSPEWRIGCIFTGKGHRGQGVARAAVAGALDAIRDAGGGVVEAYPEQVEGRSPQRGAYFHTGPESLFAEFGFERDRRIAKWRWVVRRQV